MYFKVNLQMKNQSFHTQIWHNFVYVFICKFVSPSVKNTFLANPDPRRSGLHVRGLLELSLNYDFEFNADTFLQITDTAIAKMLAPSYANIFMAEWETTAVDKCY